eukprot:235105-Prorocentrum_minimum.AAC.3
MTGQSDAGSAGIFSRRTNRSGVTNAHLLGQIQEGGVEGAQHGRGRLHQVGDLVRQVALAASWHHPAHLARPHWPPRPHLSVGLDTDTLTSGLVIKSKLAAGEFDSPVVL